MRASGVWPTLLWVNLSAVHSGLLRVPEIKIFVTAISG